MWACLKKRSRKILGKKAKKGELGPEKQNFLK